MVETAPLFPPSSLCEQDRKGGESTGPEGKEGGWWWGGIHTSYGDNRAADATPFCLARLGLFPPTHTMHDHAFCGRSTLALYKERVSPELCTIWR